MMSILALCSMAVCENTSDICFVWAASFSLWQLRASQNTSTQSGTIFVAIPPLIMPIFAVVSASILPDLILAIAIAAIVIALIPSSGASPACAALPLIFAVMLSCPGALTMTLPGLPLESRQKPKSDLIHSLSRYFEPSRPPSSDTVKMI